MNKITTKLLKNGTYATYLGSMYNGNTIAGVGVNPEESLICFCKEVLKQSGHITNNRILAISDVAKLLRVPQALIKELINNGEIKAKKMSKASTRILESEVMKYLNS